MINPLNIMAAASQPDGQGGSKVDILALVVALITTAKMVDADLAEVFATLKEEWPKVNIVDDGRDDFFIELPPKEERH